MYKVFTREEFIKIFINRHPLVEYETAEQFIDLVSKGEKAWDLYCKGVDEKNTPSKLDIRVLKK